MVCKLLKSFKGFTIEKSYALDALGRIDKNDVHYDAYDTNGDYFNGSTDLVALKKTITEYIK